MIDNIKSILMTIVITLAFLGGVFTFFMFINNESKPTITDFENQAEIFKECSGENYTEKHDEALLIDKLDFDEYSLEQLATDLNMNTFETNCYSEYTRSLEGDINNYSELALNKATDYFGEQAMFINTIYETPTEYSAYLNKPQQYLYFALNENQTNIVGVIVTPVIDGDVEIEFTWEYDQSSDVNYTAETSNKMLLKFTNKK